MSTPKQILDEVRAAVEGLAEELEAELRGRYQHTMDYPAMKDRFDCDMEQVNEARAALAKLDSLEMVEGRAWRMEGEPHFTVTNLYPPDTHDALLLTKGDT